MPPRTPCSPDFRDVDEIHQDEVLAEEECRPDQPLVWQNFIRVGAVHVGALIGLYMLPSCQLYTLLFTVVAYFFGALGITAGAHRLWSHRSYKARLPFRIFLGACNSMAFQNDIIEWSRDHRVHHKFSETDADPHNAKRGFFFAHMGWLLMRKHPLVKSKGKTIDMSDLYRDPVCVWQRRFYLPSAILMCFIVPTVIPWYYWGEDPWTAYFVCGFLRYVLSLHFTWCVNSVAHLFGNKPYDRFINPVENLFVTIFAVGEGFHNYHHTFPQDYSTSELGMRLNLTTMFLDFMALFGQVYDRKKMPDNLVKQRMLRTGDGTTGFGYSKLETAEESTKEK